MTERQLVEVLNVAVLVAFISGLLIAAGKTVQRALWYLGHRWRRPRLLTRDAISYGGLAMSFLLVGLARAFNWTPTVAGRWWWIVLTAAPGLVGIWTYVWYEFRVIEQASGRRAR